jgi:hypothetical protein
MRHLTRCAGCQSKAGGGPRIAVEGSVVLAALLWLGHPVTGFAKPSETAMLREYLAARFAQAIANPGDPEET